MGEAHRMLRPALLLSTLVACSLAAEFSTTASFTVKVGKTKKTANCDITISYDGAVVSQADSSASCSVAWAKKKAPSAVKTSINSITTSPLAADPEFYPASLWCPQEDYLIWGQGAFESVVDEAAATGYEECAQRCAEFTNEAGNSPCFSWTMNSNAGEALGLPGGNCRLLAYMNVSGIAFPGVQSGYHKCWNAAQTLNP